MQINNSVYVGTVGGTFLSMLPHLLSVDIMKTVLLAAVGAIVSFTLSTLLKYLVSKFRKK